MSKRPSESSSSEKSKRFSGTQPNTFDISYVPKRSVSMAQRELTYSSSAFSWKKNHALQTCTDTGVGDCPVCLGDRYSCHAEECQLCCEPKTCGPEFNACPFVPGMGAQTDPICDFSTLSCRCIGESCGTDKECRLAGNCGTTGMECLCQEKSCNTTGKCIVVEDETGEFTGQCVDENEESCVLTELACRCKNDYQNYNTEKVITHSAKTYSKQSIRGPHDTSLYVNSIKSFPTVADVTDTEKKGCKNGTSLKLRQTTNHRRESNESKRESVETERIRKPQACYKETCGVCFEDDELVLKSGKVFADEVVLKQKRDMARKSMINENLEGQSVKMTQECKCGEDGECRQAKSNQKDELQQMYESEDRDETEETFHDVIEEPYDEPKPDKRIHITEEIRPDSFRASKHIIRNVATSVRPFKSYCGCNDKLQKSGSHRLVLCECVTTNGGCVLPAKCSKSSTRRECYHENDEILILHLANSKKCNKCRPFNLGPQI